MNKRTKQSRRPSSAPADTQHAEATHSAPPSLSLQDVLAGLKQLPQDWHACGCLLPDVLDAIARHTAGKDIRCSAETGTGKSTVLLSHISKQHLTFALNSGESITTSFFSSTTLPP